MSIEKKLKQFNPATAGKYDPGHIVIFFDGRIYGPPVSKMSYLQTGWLSAKYYLGWPSYVYTYVPPGKLRLVFYTHEGTEGSKDFDLWDAMIANQAFDDLCDEGFRPMIIGWSAENPFPMIGGSEPPPEPKKPKVKVATTWSSSVSGHSSGDTPHDRVMRIIQKEDEREAEERRKEVEEVGRGELAV